MHRETRVRSNREVDVIQRAFPLESTQDFQLYSRGLSPSTTPGDVAIVAEATPQHSHHVRRQTDGLDKPYHVNVAD